MICKKAVGVTLGHAPSHPNRPNEPGIFEPAVLRGKPCVALVDAAFAVSSKLDDTRLDDLANGAVGSILSSPGHAPVTASALSVGDLSVRMRHDGHEPNGAEKQ
jgi:hypothetical protein